MKRDESLFFTCSLIECIGRERRQPRAEIVRLLGPDLERIYSHADVFHCEPILKVADDFIERAGIPLGSYDVLSGVRYAIPDCWDIGEVFERLAEDCAGDLDVLSALRGIYASWITPAILNFNSDLYYQPREYLAACYREGRIIAA